MVLELMGEQVILQFQESTARRTYGNTCGSGTRG